MELNLRREAFKASAVYHRRLLVLGGIYKPDGDIYECLPRVCFTAGAEWVNTLFTKKIEKLINSLDGINCNFAGKRRIKKFLKRVPVFEEKQRRRPLPKRGQRKKRIGRL